MKIHVYTICWNEEKLLPFFIRYYQQFADKIIFFDNESTDNSRNIIEASDKCHYRTYASSNEIRDDLYRDLKNNMWKESRGKADFVIVVDIDEIVYSPYNLKNYLRLIKFLGFTLVRPFGYNMITDQLDWNSKKQITELVKDGSHWAPMNKPCIFNPTKIKEVNFGYGAHSCSPTGKKRIFRADWLSKYVNVGLYLLHYKMMGVEYLVKRHMDLAIRLSAFNREKKLSLHYDTTEKEIQMGFDNQKLKATKVI